jgi:hypothetical protein
MLSLSSDNWKTRSSPYINRFLQPDTVIPDLSNPQSWNRYSYVRNNPILYNDPTGHAEDVPFDEGKCDKGCAKLELAFKIQKKYKNVKIENPRSWDLHELRGIEQGLDLINGKNGFNGNMDAFNSVFGSVTFSLYDFPQDGKAGGASWDPNTGVGTIRLDPKISGVGDVLHEMGHLLSWTYKRQQKDDSLHSYAQMYPNVFNAVSGTTTQGKKNPGEDFAESFKNVIFYGASEKNPISFDRIYTINVLIQSYTDPDYGTGR